MPQRRVLGVMPEVGDDRQEDVTFVRACTAAVLGAAGSVSDACCRWEITAARGAFLKACSLPAFTKCDQADSSG